MNGWRVLSNVLVCESLLWIFIYLSTGKLFALVSMLTHSFIAVIVNQLKVKNQGGESNQ